MDEFQENIEQIEAVLDEIVALLPEEATTDLEVKTAELVARVVQHLEYMAETGDEEGANEEEAEEGEEVLEAEAAAGA
ncbi:MAG: hypothetical protein FJ271_34215 [Planctomycetes bacterium]|nr:hypothetical protein [Planctomycetota bacterium]